MLTFSQLSNADLLLQYEEFPATDGISTKEQTMLDRGAMNDVHYIRLRKHTDHAMQFVDP